MSIEQIYLSENGFAGNLPKIVQVADVDLFWAIEESWANSALARLASLTVDQVAQIQIEMAAGPGEGKKERKIYEVKGNTAVLPIDGPMTKKPTSASILFGGTSTIEVRSALREIAANPKIGQVLLLFSSPGGQVEGTAELGDDVREFSKPIASYIDGPCCSAAYWIASQTNAIYSGRTGVTASIGVKMAPLYDTSRLMSMLGVDSYPLTSGDLKSVGDKGVKITPAQLAYMQGLVSGLFDEFASAVRTGRTMTDDAFASVASGRVVLAREALTLGLIDGICSLEECFKTISGGQPPAKSPTAGKPAKDPAKASNASAKGNPMNLKELVGRLRGIDPQALSDAGIDPEALDTNETPVAAVVPQSVLDQIAKLEAQTARQETEIEVQRQLNAKAQAAGIQARADRFWDMLITPDKDGKALATWAQKDGVIATFKTLAALDGPKFGDTGEMIVGASLEAFMSSMLGAARNEFQKELLEGRAPTPVKGTQGSAEDLESVLGGTMLAKDAEKIAAEKFGNGGNK